MTNPANTQSARNGADGRIFFLDVGGSRVVSANPDGSDLKTILVEKDKELPDGLAVETLVDTSQGDPRPGPDATKWCVGIAVDVKGGKFYWTQKGPDNGDKGRIFRANVEIPPGETPANRRDVELVYDKLPEPIDLEIDPATRTLYWTDRGDPPRGNTVNRAPLDSPSGKRKAPEIIFSHLMEGIGLALDHAGGRMFVTDLGGSVYSANVDGSKPKVLLFAQGNLTGIAYAK